MLRCACYGVRTLLKFIPIQVKLNNLANMKLGGDTTEAKVPPQATPAHSDGESDADSATDYEEDLANKRRDYIATMENHEDATPQTTSQLEHTLHFFEKSAFDKTRHFITNVSTCLVPCCAHSHASYSHQVLRDWLCRIGLYDVVCEHRYAWSTTTRLALDGLPSGIPRTMDKFYGATEVDEYGRAWQRHQYAKLGREFDPDDLPPKEWTTPRALAIQTVRATTKLNRNILFSRIAGDDQGECRNFVTTVTPTVTHVFRLHSPPSGDITSKDNEGDNSGSKSTAAPEAEAPTALTEQKDGAPPDSDPRVTVLHSIYPLARHKDKRLQGEPCGVFAKDLIKKGTRLDGLEDYLPYMTKIRPSSQCKDSINARKGKSAADPIVVEQDIHAREEIFIYDRIDGPDSDDEEALQLEVAEEGKPAPHAQAHARA